MDGVESSSYDDMAMLPLVEGLSIFMTFAFQKNYLIGELNAGFKQVMNGFDLSRLLIGLQCVGAAVQSLMRRFNT
ncbi:hypothetical protein [Geomicrobium sp. JCM 19055]|uniref:hypothetical protein n=1 Tax=Geomicrobium sp. JCM 19055 TaxID=1460649 RepID=UPI0022364657|nr:hypothetical protein [Geomicrobium sp. JCM 19055]